MIYLDNAATTLQKPDCVIEAVITAMRTAGNAARGAHGGSLAAARTVYNARETVAKFFGCPRADHVVFTQNATESLNIVLNGLFHKGDHVITTALEHNSVLRPLYRLEAEGMITLDIAPADANGNLDDAHLESMIDAQTRALVCTHASNLTGNLIDIKRMSEIAHAHNLLLVVDASQTAGVMPINMTELGIDVLCFTGHKGLMGPQGTGGLCIRPGVEIRPFKVGGSGVHSFDRAQPNEYPTRLEAGTLNTHGIAGLVAAIEWINEIGLDTIRKKETMLMRRFYEGVSAIDGVTVYGDFSAERAAIVSLNIQEEDSAAIADALSEDYGIAVRAGAHCAPLMHEALGTAKQGAVRFSFSYFNTEEEVDAAIRAVHELAE